MTAEVIPKRFFVNDEDKQALKTARFSFANLHKRPIESLLKRIDLPDSRIRELCALSEVSSLHSVGPSLASMIVAIGYDSLNRLVGANPKKMYDQLNTQFGIRFDPCVEDVFRCAVAQASYKDLPAESRDWWYWTPHRGKSDVAFPLEIVTGNVDE
ncbi:MAG: helix-hairpin-helix domain-containing protein [Aestuariibacter sp.]